MPAPLRVLVATTSPTAALSMGVADTKAVPSGLSPLALSPLRPCLSVATRSLIARHRPTHEALRRLLPQALVSAADFSAARAKEVALSDWTRDVSAATPAAVVGPPPAKQQGAQVWSATSDADAPHFLGTAGSMDSGGRGGGEGQPSESSGRAGMETPHWLRSPSTQGGSRRAKGKKGRTGVLGNNGGRAGKLEGKEAMDFEGFFESIFELTDLWCV